MSYLEQSKQNKANAQKAQAFDAQQTKKRAQKVYEAGLGAGTNEAYRAVEQLLVQNADAQRRQEEVNVADEEAAWRSSPDNQALVAEAADLGYWDPASDPSGDIAAVDRMVFDKREAEEQSLAATQDITPAPAGLADSFRGL